MANFSFVMNPSGKSRVLHREGVDDSVSHVDTSSLPDEYSSLLAANPYSHYDYTKSVWDRIGNFFGFRTREDKYREEMQQASREFEAQLLSMAREEEYNSPVEQASRQRQAGINPDLNGVEPSQAAEYNEPETRPSPPEPGEGLEQAGNVFSAAMSAVGIVKDFGLLNSLRLDNENKQYTNIRGLFETVRRFIGDTSSSDELFGSGSELLGKFDDMLSKFIPNKRRRKRFSDAILAAVGSTHERSQSYSDIKTENDNRKGALTSEAFFQGIKDAANAEGDSFAVNDNDIMNTKLFKRISRYEWAVYKAERKLEMKKAKIAAHQARSAKAGADLDVAQANAQIAAGVPDAQAQSMVAESNLRFENANAEIAAGVPAARAGNAFWQNQLQKAMNQYAYEIRQSFYSMVHDAFRDGSPLSQAFLMALLGGETIGMPLLKGGLSISGPTNITKVFPKMAYPFM